MSRTNHIGVVAIGRNEGVRLQTCLKSLQRSFETIVYVDSGSTDDSVNFAQQIGVDVVTLDSDIPFSAARARNAGAQRLTELQPGIEFIQFIDGDCEILDTWVPAAISALEKSSGSAAICGRLRERFREATLYNLMCDLEWQASSQTAPTCGGIFIVRTSVFQEIEGFNDNVIAAEDDELCVRIRNAGFDIIRTDQDMALHDANITQFRQWWQRAVRAGHGYAQVGVLHQGYFLRSRQRAWAWGGVLPLIAFGGAPFTSGFSLLLCLLYIASFFRTKANLAKQNIKQADARIYAVFLTLSKFPNLLGILIYWKRRFMNQGRQIIEYK